MTCEELKYKILSRSVDDSILIFTYGAKDSTSRFVMNQYIYYICRDKHLQKEYIESLDEISLEANAFFGTDKDVMYILMTDKFVCSETLNQYKNLIVICKEVVNGKQYEDRVIKFSPLTKDQIVEYMEVTCPGLSEDIINWLYDITNGDIFRIDIELKKLSVFSKTNQNDMFKQLYHENGYSDMNNTTIYNLVNAIIDKDIKTMQYVMNHLDVIDVEGTGLVTILIRNLKNIIDIQTNAKATAESTGMSSKQFYAVSRKCGKFTLKQLVNMFEFLTDIDYRLKYGLLDMTNSQLVGYVLTNIAEVGYETIK